MFKEIVVRVYKDIKKYYPIALAVVALYFLLHFLFDAFCPMVILTGLPCPGCGLTRSILFLLTGQFMRSLSLQPLGIFVLGFLLYCTFFRYLLGKKIPACKLLLWILLLAAVGIYLVGMWRFFPNRPPYTYSQENLLHHFFERLS